MATGSICGTKVLLCQMFDVLYNTRMTNTLSDYEQFIQGKRLRVANVGKHVEDSDIHPMLFPFQRAVTKWAIAKGRCAVFLDTGLGKSLIQLEFSRLIGERTLIIAPLSVAHQTVREGKKIDVEVRYVRHQSEMDGDHKIWITNYEMAEEFDPAMFGCVVLDESSILKALSSKTRVKLTAMFKDTPYRMCCTATPAPNDQAEIGNHAEFLGVMKNVVMLATYFINANKVDEIATELGNGRTAIVRRKHSNKEGQEWRVRHHGREGFYHWLSSWAISLRLPSDLGYDDDGFILPALNIYPVIIDVDYVPEGQLFFTGLKGIQGRHEVRRSTLEERVAKTAELVNRNDEQWIVWCGLNPESSAIHEAIPDSVEIVGSDTPEYKAKAIEDFQDGEYKVMISKVKIAGFGMNFQCAHNMAFLGLGDSFEMYYQAIRREWRFGQTRPVNVYIVISSAEQEIYSNVLKKEAMAKMMQQELINHVKGYEQEELGMKKVNVKVEYKEETITGNGWIAMLGDSCTRLSELTDDSIDLSVYSPPFADLFVYSDSDRDLGNSKDWAEFFNHYAFLIREILRVTKPGRITCVHTADIPAMAVRDGYIGMKDFPGEVIRAYEAGGWTFIGRAIVAKNPQAQSIRIHAKALAFQQLRKDSSDMRPAILDQVLMFKKPGENAIPVLPVANGEIDNEKWIDWAGGIWLGINESDTLQFTTARDKDDERHICPLQLGTIERCIKLYSNPGETVLTPFMGIGSEAYQAIRFGRKAIGIELKESYFNVAVKNLRDSEAKYRSEDLMEWADKQKGD